MDGKRDADSEPVGPFPGERDRTRAGHRAALPGQAGGRELLGPTLGNLSRAYCSHFNFPTFFSMTSGSWDQWSESWRATGSDKALTDGRSVTRVAANRNGVRLVPLDLITSVQFTKSAGILDWLTGQVLLVTTADGAEYEFRGMMAGWQAAIADALTVRGREVRVVRDVITVMPQVMGGEG